MENISKYLNDHKSTILKKWSPIIENNFINCKNKLLVEYICLYCEWFSMIEDQKRPTGFIDRSELPNRLSDIIDRVNGVSKKRILGKFINPLSGSIEYELEDGTRIQENTSDIKISVDHKIELFGIEFIRDLDPQEFREGQLNKIL